MTSRRRNLGSGRPLRHEFGFCVIAAATCPNCGAGLAGRYCSNCGQAADVHVPSTRELIHEVLEGLTHSDSRIWSTLKYLLVSPGKLTLEFVAGRRAAYLPPFRLYLILSVAFFLIASFSHSQVEVIRVGDGNLHRTQESDCTNGSIDFGWLAKHPEWQARFQRACMAVVRDNGSSVLHAAVAVMPKAMFVFLPLIAFLHMLMYWWPRHRYAVHLLFFLHLHAFFFFVEALLWLSDDAAAAWPRIAPLDNVVAVVLNWAFVVYTVLAMRRVFRMGWWLTLAKALALSLVYFSMLGLTISIVFIYAALQL
jgi:hypothetical protein